MKDFRVRIGIFGRMNAGKSSLINALTNQDVAIVSDVPGTTTDPVSKSMELLPLGPVTFIDTAGIDDASDLGRQRVERAINVLNDVDMALLVIDACSLNSTSLGNYEESIIEEAKKRNVPVVGVLNKIDLCEVSDETLSNLMEKYGIPFVRISTKTKEGLITLKREIVAYAPVEHEIPLVADLCRGGEAVLYVFPKKIEFPKGRLPLTWIRALRETIDQDAYCVVAREDNVKETLEYLDRKIELAVVDAKAYENAYIPETKITSFSVLEARYKGDLTTLVRGVRELENLTERDTVLVVNACDMQNNPDDSWKDFVVNWLKSRCRVEVGNDVKEDYRLVIHCNACRLRREEMIERIRKVRESGGQITMIGLSACWIKGILKDFLDPFPPARIVLEGEDVGEVPYEFLRGVKTCLANVWKY